MGVGVGFMDQRFWTSVWVLCTPNNGQNILFHIFRMKNLKKKGKAGKMRQIKIFWLAPKCGCRFYTQKKMFFFLKIKTCFQV